MSQTMKAALLTGIRGLRIGEIPRPRVQRDTDVLLRVREVGLCGSDVHYYTTGRIGSQVVQYPFPVGHETAATVEEVGAAVRRVRPGDRVAIEPAMSCGQCDQCRAGRPHTCRKTRFLGCPGQVEGSLSEYIVMPQECCYPVPEGLTLEQASLAEPLSIGIYAVKLAGDLRGRRMAILGFGPIGISVFLAAREAGAEAVHITEPIAERAAQARKLGPAWVGDPLRGDAVREILSREPLGMDVVFECCGKQEALDQSIDLLKPGGKLMFIGIPEVDRVSFGCDPIRRKEICIQNVRRQNHCMQAAVDLLSGRRGIMDFALTHRFPFDRSKEAFDLVADYRDGVIKAMIHVA
jgi:L-iditol 2-dehydrogenase